MRETRGSGLKWAGKIPTDWKITKGKYFMSALERPVRDDDGVITCFRDGVVTLRSNRREDGFTIATVEAGYQGIEPGDLVVHGMDGFAGAIGISDSRGKGTPALNILDCTENKRYIMYLLRSMAFSEVFMALSTGIRVRTCDTNWRKLRELDYLIPPINQQRLIFEYLDRKCTEIDLLTADIQTQIETLEQYKRSVITEAVTKGLNPDAEMKDSGVPWIGMLPAHWEVKKTKFLFEIVKRIAGREGFDVLSVTQKGLKVKDLTDYSGQIAENYSGYQFVYPTDYVMNHMDLLTGWVDCSKQFGVTSPDYRVFRLLSKDEHNLDYFKYIFQCLYMNKVYYSFGNGVSGLGRWRLQASTFLNFFLPVPPCAEQHQIASYISNKVLKINGIIDEKRNQLSVLDSYKKSLIFEYVTGKKKVPAATNPVTITAIDPHIILAGVAINGLGTRQLGKIQLEKALYLFDYYLGLGLSTQYYRFPHGPYDLSLDSYLAALQGNGWFKKISNFPEKYLAGENHCDFCEEAEKNSMLLNAKDALDKVISFIKAMKKTSQVERVATLFAAWNDFLIDGITPSDDQIIREVMNNWTENKGNTQYLTWKSSLDKIKRSGIVPKGMGLHTLPMQEGGKSDA